MLKIPKPSPGEFAPYAAAYIDLVLEEVALLSHLRHGDNVVFDLVSRIPEAQLAVPFAPGEWTVKQILVHIIDQERVFAYRALRFARGDTTELATFNHDAYVETSKANQRSLDAILAEYRAVRQSTLTLFEGFDDSVLACAGKVGGHSTSVRALAWLIAGHELHHLTSIRNNYVDGSATNRYNNREDIS